MVAIRGNGHRTYSLRCQEDSSIVDTIANIHRTNADRQYNYNHQANMLMHSNTARRAQGSVPVGSKAPHVSHLSFLRFRSPQFAIRSGRLHLVDCYSQLVCSERPLARHAGHRRTRPGFLQGRFVARLSGENHRRCQAQFLNGGLLRS